MNKCEFLKLLMFPNKIVNVKEQIKNIELMKHKQKQDQMIRSPGTCSIEHHTSEYVHNTWVMDSAFWLFKHI